ncbi:MAG: hypothetical protein JW395_1893 [Nitrospira sp.]|nr:hypothetical protein [Nitrospira sp.]
MILWQNPLGSRQIGRLRAEIVRDHRKILERPKAFDARPLGINFGLCVTKVLELPSGIQWLKRCEKLLRGVELLHIALPPPLAKERSSPEG